MTKTEDIWESNKIPCRGCKTKQDVSEQKDAYGYSTGYWCDSCYEGDRYPYRRDRYFDASYAGERLENDY